MDQEVEAELMRVLKDASPDLIVNTAGE